MKLHLDPLRSTGLAVDGTVFRSTRVRLCSNPRKPLTCQAQVAGPDTSQPRTHVCIIGVVKPLIQALARLGARLHQRSVWSLGGCIPPMRLLLMRAISRVSFRHGKAAQLRPCVLPCPSRGGIRFSQLPQVSDNRTRIWNSFGCGPDWGCVPKSHCGLG